MKVCVFSVSMPEYDIEQSAALLKELGYDAVEWRVTTIPEKEPENVPFAVRYWAWNKSTLDVKNIKAEAARAKAICDKYGIEMYALSSYLPTNMTAEIREVFEAARDTGTRFVRIGLCGFNPAKSEDTYPVAFNKMREDLKVIEGIARETGVKALTEIHMDTLISSPSAAYRALEGFDSNCIGLIYDPGNMVNEGFEDTLKSFQLLGDYIAHVHVKNGKLEYDGKDEFGAAKWKRVQTPLDEGMADLYNLFCVMKRMGYKGAVSVEDFSNEQTTKEKLAHNVGYIRKLIENADPEKAY